MNKYDTMQYNTACSVSIIFLFLLHININIWYHHNAYLILIFSADMCTQAVQVSANTLNFLRWGVATSTGRL